ncbi:MAG: hypothetical protein EGQ16_01470 [Clostridiales bacterium]|nr:hypothetical protein [Clostridiales bacterium]
MRKMLIIIGILSIIFFGMIAYRKLEVKNSTTVNAGEVTQIQSYIEKIYLWKEVTKEALPTFSDINQANDKWIWEVVKNNLDDYEISLEEANKKVKELFGKECNKQMPKEGNSSFIYNEESGKYEATGVELDNKQDTFLINNITKTKDGYQVEIIEYLINHMNENNITVENTNEESLGTVGNSANDTKIQDIVKQNKSRFTKKKITLKKESESENSLVVEKVEKN